MQFADRAVDFLAERDAVELVEHRLVEPLDDSIGLMLEVADSVGRAGCCGCGVPMLSTERLEVSR